jgi:hypothetical protein
MKKLLELFLLSAVILVIGCNAPEINNPGNISGLNNLNEESAAITLDIKSLEFETKAVSPVKSFSAFLSTNFANPFIAGTNPLGDGVMVKVNNSSETGSLVFSHVPRGGPYYAVVAAYDTLIDAAVPNNITAIDPTLLSPDKKWARSTNNVTVNIARKLVFSDTNTILKVNLNLAPVIFNTIPVVVSPVTGNSTKGTIGVAQ